VLGRAQPLVLASYFALIQASRVHRVSSDARHSALKMCLSHKMGPSHKLVADSYLRSSNCLFMTSAYSLMHALLITTTGSSMSGHV
jgi:hypothetical protein